MPAREGKFSVSEFASPPPSQVLTFLSRTFISVLARTRLYKSAFELIGSNSSQMLKKSYQKLLVTLVIETRRICILQGTFFPVRMNR